MPRTLTLLAVLALGTGACATRVEYREDPPPTVSFAAGPACSPDYPCLNTYYWDEWRGVYVFYDGARYIDCTGRPGGYPLPPYGFAYGPPPRGYVPPSAWVPAPGTYRPPVGYVRGRVPPPSPVVVQPPPPARAGTYGFNAPPPNAGSVSVAPPSASRGEIAAPAAPARVEIEQPAGWTRRNPAGGFPSEAVQPTEPPEQHPQTGTHAEGGAASEPHGTYRAEPERTWQPAAAQPGRGFEAPSGTSRAEPAHSYEPPVTRAENPAPPPAERLPPPGAVPAQPASRKPPPPPEPVHPAPALAPAGAPMHHGAH